MTEVDTSGIMDIIYKVLDEECWGAIEVRWFKHPEAYGIKEDENPEEFHEHLESYESLMQILKKAIEEHGSSSNGT